jgi:mono/diheme cytochrome c family protein
MKQKRLLAVTALGVFLLIGFAVTRSQTAVLVATDGKALFLEAKCNTCHTVASAGITKKAAAVADPADAKTANKPPDLSSVGLERKAEWIEKFLNKTESIKGEKHPRKFRGTEPQLKILASWLTTMKAPKK